MNAKPLLSASQLRISQGARVLITGRSGSGKSTLLRAICGLSRYGEGTITIPKQKTILFAPQVPYVLNDASLKANICYPFAETDYTDEQVEQVLALANLAPLIPFLHQPGRDETAWRALSVGEKQRLVFARIYLHRPDVVLLDEATSALDAEIQESMYKRLIEQLPEATIISVAHRKGLTHHHQLNIEVHDHRLYLHPLSKIVELPARTAVPKPAPIPVEAVPERELA